MRRRLFEDLVVSGAKGVRTRGRYAFPVSAVFHAAVLCAAVVVPVLTQGALPDDVVHGAPPGPVFLPPPPPPEGAQATAPTLPRTSAPRERRLELPAPNAVEPPATEPEMVGGTEETGSNPGCSGCAIGNALQDGVPGGDPGGTFSGVPPREPLHVGGDIQPPRKVQHVNPVYPELARHAHVQGTVILECVIGPDGRVANVRLLRGVPLLDAAAMDAVRQWRYEPTRLNGIPVAVVMTVTVKFIIG